MIARPICEDHESKTFTIPLYDKYDPADQIEFTFHFMPIANVLIFLIATASLAPGGKRTNKLRPLCAILLSFG